jgi:hypothetical protein
MSNVGAARCDRESRDGRRSLTKALYFIWPISLAAPFVVFASCNSASRPPAA